MKNNLPSLFFARFLSAFLIAAFCLPGPAGAGPELGRRTLRPTIEGKVEAGVEEALSPPEELHQLANLFTPVTTAAGIVKLLSQQAGDQQMEEAISKVLALSAQMMKDARELMRTLQKGEETADLAGLKDQIRQMKEYGSHLTEKQMEQFVAQTRQAGKFPSFMEAKVQVIVDLPDYMQDAAISMEDFLSRLASPPAAPAAAPERKRRVDAVNLLLSEFVDREGPPAGSDVSVEFGGLAGVPEGIPLVVDAQRGKAIDDTLLELLKNAKRYRRPGLELKILVEARYDPAAEQLRVTLTDNGVGMREEDMKRYGQGGMGTLPEGMEVPDRAGIGIAAQKKALQMLGGGLKLISSRFVSEAAPGETPGSVVEFWLPVPKPAAPAAGAEEKSRGQLIREAVTRVAPDLAAKLKEKDWETLQRTGLTVPEVRRVLRPLVNRKELEWRAVDVWNAVYRVIQRKLAEVTEKERRLPAGKAASKPTASDPLSSWVDRDLLPAMRGFLGSGSVEFSILRSVAGLPPDQQKGWQDLVDAFERWSAEERGKGTDPVGILSGWIERLNRDWLAPRQKLLIRRFRLDELQETALTSAGMLVLVELERPPMEFTLEGESIPVYFVRAPEDLFFYAVYSPLLRAVVVSPARYDSVNNPWHPFVADDLPAGAKTAAQEAYEMLGEQLRGRYGAPKSYTHARRSFVLLEELRHALDFRRMDRQAGRRLAELPSAEERDFWMDAHLRPETGKPPGRLWQIWEDPFADPRVARMDAARLKPVIVSIATELSGQLTRAIADPKMSLRDWLVAVLNRNQEVMSPVGPMTAYAVVRLLSEEMGVKQGHRFEPLHWSTGQVSMEQLFRMVAGLARQPDERLRLAIKNVYAREFNHPVDEPPFLLITPEGNVSSQHPALLPAPAAGAEEAMKVGELKIPAAGLDLDGLTVKATGQVAVGLEEYLEPGKEATIMMLAAGQPQVAVLAVSAGVRELQASLAGSGIEVRRVPDPENSRDFLAEEPADLLLVTPEDAAQGDWRGSSGVPTVILPASVAAGLEQKDLSVLAAAARARGGILHINEITRSGAEEQSGFVVLHMA